MLLLFLIWINYLFIRFLQCQDTRWPVSLPIFEKTQEDTPLWTMQRQVEGYSTCPTNGKVQNVPSEENSQAFIWRCPLPQMCQRKVIISILKVVIVIAYFITILKVAILALNKAACKASRIQLRSFTTWFIELESIAILIKPY